MNTMEEYPNLIPYQPGQSGNPNGRPKLTPEQKAVKKAIKEMVKEYKEKLAEALVEISPILIAEALKGNIQAIKEINDRVMGKPEQQTDITSGGEKINPVPILNVIPGNNSNQQNTEPKQET